MENEFLQALAQAIDAYRDAGQIELLKYALLVTLVPSAVVTLVFFLLRAIGLYRLNIRLGNKGAFLAFVPGLSGYAFGAAADGLKKRKPSNYQIHMLMLGLFHFILNAIVTIYTAGRVLFLIEKLEAGGDIDTLALLDRVFSVGKNEPSDRILYLSYVALQILVYVVEFVSILCYMRIIQLYRKGGLLLLFGAIFFSPVIDIYLFAMRNRPIHQYLPIFRMPDGTTFNPNGEGYEDSGEKPIDLGRDEANDNPTDEPTDGDRTDTNGASSEDSDENK